MPACCLPAACLLPACCLPAACLLSPCCLPAACLLPACCLTVTCLIPACQPSSNQQPLCQPTFMYAFLPPCLAICSSACLSFHLPASLSSCFPVCLTGSLCVFSLLFLYVCRSFCISVLTRPCFLVSLSFKQQYFYGNLPASKSRHPAPCKQQVH
jgi:hypothetical protein